MVERGLLTARSSKLYEPSDVEVDVSIPERRYDIVGEIMLAALDQDAPEPPREVAKRVANQKGRALGESVRTKLRLRPPGGERALSVAEEALAEYGFEPYREEPATVALRNCPFHRLARQAPELVCALNREFIDGFLRGLGNDTVEAALAPTPGQCCVKLRAPSA